MKTIKENAEELVHLNMIMRADCPIKIPNPKAHDWIVDFLTKFAEQQVKNLNIPAVMQRSELLSRPECCPECCSGNIYMAMNEEYLCLECKHEWAT
ncbi:MAG: hypothetical protein H8D45_08000 [Bacteroidetes bacterium]|nr:hypothetical protein [Bacteroidota bacterium]